MSFRAGVLVFPGSNCDRDIAVALAARRRRGRDGLAQGDRRCRPGSTSSPSPAASRSATTCAAARSRRARRSCARSSAFAEAGGHVLGVCNGFQVLIEAGLLPGALMRNAGLKFVCAAGAADASATADSAFTRGYRARRDDRAADRPPRRQLRRRRRHPRAARGRGPGRLPLRGEPERLDARDIAGILSPNRRVLGLMPHPERAADPAHGGTDGVRLFAGLAAVLGAGRAARRLSGAPAGTRSRAMSKAADAPRPNAHPGRFWMRVGLLASVLGMVLVIWASHIYLTRAFSEDQNADATVRATLYAGSIQSTMQRHAVVPLLLSRDPILILALRIGHVRRRRGAAGDASGRRSAPARSSCSTPRAASWRRATSGRASSTTATRRTSRWRRPTPAPSSRSSRTTTAPTASTTPAA